MLAMEIHRDEFMTFVQRCGYRRSDVLNPIQRLP
jgi:hypothetical protein